MEALEFLLSNGADPNIKNSKNFTLLMYCVKYADIKLVKTVLYHGARINEKDLSGFSALDYAIEKNNLEIVRFLVENGANISDHSYMLALKSNFKAIVCYFDSLDPEMEIFYKASCK